MSWLTDIVKEFSEPIAEIQQIVKDAAGEIIQAKDEVTENASALKEGLAEKAKPVTDFLNKK